MITITRHRARALHLPLGSPFEPEVPAIETAMRRAGIPTPVPEHAFCPGRRWRFDYAWPSWRIALEIEGGTFGRMITITSGFEHRKGQKIPIRSGTTIRAGGRHNSGAGLEADAHKYNRAAILGWLVIRATPNALTDGTALDHLREAFSSRGLE